VFAPVAGLIVGGVWLWAYARHRTPASKDERGKDSDAGVDLVRVVVWPLLVADALDLYVADCARTGVQCHVGRVAALRHALGTTALAALTRARLDALCDEWQARGVRYLERNTKFHQLRPITGAACNRFMATLERARTLANPGFL